jgi:ribosomal protein L35
MRKTKKAVSKRVSITRTGKIMRRTMGLDHFKTRQTSKVNRNKRHTATIDKKDVRTFSKYLPHQ